MDFSIGEDEEIRELIYNWRSIHNNIRYREQSKKSSLTSGQLSSSHLLVVFAIAREFMGRQFIFYIYRFTLSQNFK
jgi:hypothetical protein